MYDFQSVETLLCFIEINSLYFLKLKHIITLLKCLLNIKRYVLYSVCYFSSAKCLSALKTLVFIYIWKCIILRKYQNFRKLN